MSDSMTRCAFVARLRWPLLALVCVLGAARAVLAAERPAEAAAVPSAGSAVLIVEQPPPIWGDPPRAPTRRPPP
jgi:hypothetical protein